MDAFLRRHNIDNEEFKEISKNSDSNYHNKPIPVLIQPKIAEILINKMGEHNIKNGNNYGFNIGSILSLVQLKKTKSKDPKYKEKFQLDEHSHGTEYLKSLLNTIISDDPMEPSIMKDIENTQSHFISRRSTNDNPKLFPMFLPLGKGDIATLQETMIKFLKKHKMWTDYYITYSNSKTNSDEDTKGYKKFVDKQLEVAKSEGKIGCILLLGNQGKMAYTYHECDVVIRLDNGTDIDDAEQVSYRCLTEGPITDNIEEQKTIGITVDLNIQRVYAVMRNKIKNYKKNNPNSKKTYGEIIQFMYKENQFIFNPNEVDFGNSTTEIVEYYKQYEQKLKSETLIDTVICNIQCEDTLSEYIKQIKLKDGTYKSNEKLNGKQPDCSKGDKTKKKGDPIKQDESEINPVEPEINPDSPEIDIFNDINKTKNLYEFLTIMSVVLLIFDYKNPNNKNKSKIELLQFLKTQKNFIIIKNKMRDDFCIQDKYLKNIYDKYIIAMDSQNNIDILDDIFEIYANTKPSELKKTIEKHFIPTKEQIKLNAEVDTSSTLTIETITIFKTHDSKFFSNEKNKTFEPSCGKGVFVYEIFDQYYDKLTHIKDEIERCRIIIEECIYFSDIDEINICITEIVLKCHAISKLGENSWDDWSKVSEIMDFKINSYVGNTLTIDIKKEFNVDKFDLIIGNPPFQEINKNGKSKHGKSNLWTKFIEYSFNNLNKNGYLLFITPTSWMGGTVSCYNKMIEKQILHLNIMDCKKHFPKVNSTFSYYLIKNTDIYENTNVVCKYNDKIYKSSIKLNKKMKLLPQLLTKESLSIVDKVLIWDNKDIFIRRDLIKNKEDCSSKENFKVDDELYPVITFIKKDTGLPDIQYTKNKLPTQDYKKVLLFRSGYLNPTYDNGQNGVGNNIHYCKVKTNVEGENLVNLYNSQLYKFIFNIFKTSQYNNGKIMNYTFNKDVDIKNIYRYFKFTEEEIKLITDN